jgi:hypothetical protein
VKKISLLSIFVILISSIFVLASCGGEFLNPKKLPESERKFWAINNVTMTFYSCHAVRLAESAHSIIYAEKDLSLSAAKAETVAARFESSVYSKITDAFGYPGDVDGNGKIIILLLNIEDDDDRSDIAGFFYPGDLFPQAFSNRGEILYINASYDENNSALYSTIAHEFQHLINRSRYLATGMEIWIDEGLSSGAEYIYGDSQSDRLSIFKNDPYNTIRWGNNFYVWNGHWEKDGRKRSGRSENDLLGNYATVYLFFQWLRIHADNGDKIYKNIIESGYTDYRAVTSAAKEHIPAFSGIDLEDWDTLIGAWQAANRLRAPSGIYGYKNQISPAFLWEYPGSGSASLDPGEGVYSSISSSVSPNETNNIRYLGLYSGSDPKTDPPYNAGGYLLTFNPNPTVEGSTESGIVADVSPSSPPALFSAAQSAADPLPSETPEQILKRWDGARVFLEKWEANTQNAGSGR